MAGARTYLCDLSKETIEEIIRRYKQGFSYDETARRVGCSRGLCRSAVRTLIPEERRKGQGRGSFSSPLITNAILLRARQMIDRMPDRGSVYNAACKVAWELDVPAQALRNALAIRSKRPDGAEFDQHGADLEVRRHTLAQIARYDQVRAARWAQAGAQGWQRA